MQGFGQRSRSPALPSNADFVDPKGRAVPAGSAGGPRVRLPVLQGPLTVSVQPDRIPFQAVRDQRQHSRDPWDPSGCQWGEGAPQSANCENRGETAEKKAEDFRQRLPSAETKGEYISSLPCSGFRWTAVRCKKITVSSPN